MILSELQPEHLSRATLIEFCKTRGVGISCSLSINAVIIVTICGHANLVESCGAQTLCYSWVDYTRRLVHACT